MTSEVTQAARDAAADVLACQGKPFIYTDEVRKGRHDNGPTVQWFARLTAQSGEQQSCEPIATVEMIETVTGDFYTEPGEPIWLVMVGEYCADFDSEQAARNFASAINLAAQSGEGRSGAGEDAVDWTSPLELLDGTPVRLTRDEETGDVDRHSNPDPDGDYWIEREDGHRIASTDCNSRSKAYRQLCVHANGCEEGTGTIVVRNRAALNARQSGEGEREKFLTAYVSEDSKIIGIEHDTDADWHKVHDAHVALRDRLEERIREREKCPRKPAVDTRATDDAGRAAKAPDTGEGE